jgi:hypothetical protein
MVCIATWHATVVDVNRGRHEYAIGIRGLAVFDKARRLSHDNHVLETP